jgi:hypothetical protein
MFYKPYAPSKGTAPILSSFVLPDISYLTHILKIRAIRKDSTWLRGSFIIDIFYYVCRFFSLWVSFFG